MAVYLYAPNYGQSSTENKRCEEIGWGATTFYNNCCDPYTYQKEVNLKVTSSKGHDTLSDEKQGDDDVNGEGVVLQKNDFAFVHD